MHDRWLIAFALCMSALGIVGLLFALIFMDIPLSTIPQARQADDGVMVRITGTVSDVRRSGIPTITISQPATIDVILPDEAQDVPVGSCVIVQGKKTTYKGKEQVNAARILACGQ
jgi:hypothetical protein